MKSFTQLSYPNLRITNNLADTMAAATLIAPRYSAEDFETTSIHSAAPSYSQSIMNTIALTLLPSQANTAPSLRSPLLPLNSYSSRTHPSILSSCAHIQPQHRRLPNPIRPASHPSRSPSDQCQPPQLPRANLVNSQRPCCTPVPQRHRASRSC